MRSSCSCSQQANRAGKVGRVGARDRGYGTPRPLTPTAYLPFRAKAAYARTKELTAYVDRAAQQPGVRSAGANEVHALIGVPGDPSIRTTRLVRVPFT